MRFGKPKVAEFSHGICYGSTTIKSLQNENIPELDLLVREAVQNSQDAAIGYAGKSDYYSIEFNRGKFSAHRFNETLPEISGRLERLFGSGEASFLEIRDSKTVGLTGPTRLADVGAEDHGNYFKLIFDTGKKQLQKGAGGNWGFGKSVYYRVGSAGIVVYYTSIVNDAGQREERLIATVIEDETKVERSLLNGLTTKQSTGRAWWGRGMVGEDVLPITDPADIQEFLSIFGLPRFGETETGTSVIIPFIDEGRLLSDVIPDATDGSVLKGCVWRESVPEYLRYSIQKWYAPKLRNTRLKEIPGAGKWLRAKVNGEMLKNDESMPSFFRLVQELYNTALSACSDIDYVPKLYGDKIKHREIVVQRKQECLKQPRAGVVAYCRITKGELDGGHAGPSPYEWSGNYVNSEKENEPIVMFAREPGMIIDYSIKGDWSKGVAAPPKQAGFEADEYIVAFFVPDVSNEFDGRLDEGLASAYGDIGGYLRSCEGSDHTAWADKSGKRLVQKIKYHVGAKVADGTKVEAKATEGVGRSSVAGRLGRLFMPPSDYDSNPPKRGAGGSGGGSGSGGARKFKVVGSSVLGERLTVRFTLPMGPGAAWTVRPELQTESGTITAKKWFSDTQARFPIEVVEATAVLTGKDGTRECVSVDRTEPSDESGPVSAELVFGEGGGRAVEVRFGCTVPGQILDGTIVLSSTSKTVECAVKAVKGGE